MCINNIFYRFGNKNKNALLAVTHNSIESLEIVEYILKNYNFNKNLLELNTSNAYFIIKNKFFHSEFYPILKKCIDKPNIVNNNNNHNKQSFIKNCKRVILIDTSIETEVSVFAKIKRNFNPNCIRFNFFDEYINYKLAKYIFYKLWAFGEFKVSDSFFDFYAAIRKMDFYQSHILFREFMFLVNIKREMLKMMTCADNSNKNKNENIQMYFGTKYEFFLQEAYHLKRYKNKESNCFICEDFNNKNRNYDSEDIEDNKNQYKNDIQNNNTNNEILVLIGKYHFDNFVKNDLL